MLCRVEGRTTIISIVPEGTKVKKGDLVCELDSALLRDQLTNQRIATQGAEASYQQCQAGPRKRRARGQGIRGRDLPAGEGHDPGRDQAGRIGAPERPGPNWSGPGDSASG